MGRMSRIALDAMGGDHAPGIVLDGADAACVRFPDAHFQLFGDEDVLRPLLEKTKRLKDRATIFHAPQSITTDQKPSAALRSGRDSSMWLAIEAVRKGDAEAVVSAGNTGALMAISKFLLRTPQGIDRPAIAAFFPTIRGETAMLDLGANIDCDAENLVQFAVMGAIFAHTALGVVNPRVGLLNVGAEELKGSEVVKAAAATLRDSSLPLEFHGFVEGNDIGAGTVDVVVTDGFSGNVALKTIEGTSQLYSTYLRETFRSSWVASLGYLLAKPALRRLRTRLDPRRYNGAVFLGLNGVVVKAHGGSDSFAFGNAVGVALDMIEHRFLDEIRTEFEKMSLGIDPTVRTAAL